MIFKWSFDLHFLVLHNLKAVNLSGSTDFHPVVIHEQFGNQLWSLEVCALRQRRPIAQQLRPHGKINACMLNSNNVGDDGRRRALPALCSQFQWLWLDPRSRSQGLTVPQKGDSARPQQLQETSSRLLISRKNLESPPCFCTLESEAKEVLSLIPHGVHLLMCRGCCNIWRINKLSRVGYSQIV